MSAFPPSPRVLFVQEPHVSCDGGGPLGHPRVYLQIGASGEIDCPYCGQKFALGMEPAEEPATPQSETPAE